MSAMAPQALIRINKERCNNCHSCISVCPVKTCVDGSGDKIAILHDRCLGCGRCIPACAHGARSINDDTDVFFEDLENGDPITVIIAPAAWTMFDDVFKLIGFLKDKRVQAVFDVSFGAELTIKSYLDYAKKEKPKLIIAQPCAALVSFCEIYEPHLLPYLAPVQSPMLHTAIMIKKFFPQYAKTKIAAISPCAAKKREFEEAGHVAYNVTMVGLKNYLIQNNIDLESFAAKDFDGPAPERAVGFSSPGGLRNTLLRDSPGLEPKIRQIEGVDRVYQYLKDIPRMIKENAAPFLVDCLSCIEGCNGGPGTDNYGQPLDLLESRINKRMSEQTKKNKSALGPSRVRSQIQKYWKAGLYDREYQNLSERLLGYRLPTQKDLNAIFLTMKKHDKSDFLNCAACGYGSCNGMAEAIYNDLNRPENCHQYLKNDVDERLGEHRKIMENVRDGIFLIEKTKRILPSYSKALEEIFRRDQLADLSLPDVLSGFISKDAMPEIKEFLEKAFDTHISKDDLDAQNPLRSIQANFLNLNGAYDIKTLEFIFARIGADGNIEKLFVLVRDISETPSATEPAPDPTASARAEPTLTALVTPNPSTEPAIAEPVLTPTEPTTAESALAPTTDITLEPFAETTMAEPAPDPTALVIPTPSTEPATAESAPAPAAVVIPPPPTEPAMTEPALAPTALVTPKPSADDSFALFTLEDDDKKMTLRFPNLNEHIDDDDLQKKLSVIFVMLAQFSFANSIEDPARRREYGKEKTGKGEADITKEDDILHFSYSDDGKGIDMEQTKKLDAVQEALKAIKAGNLRLTSRKNQFFRLEWDL